MMAKEKLELGKLTDRRKYFEQFISNYSGLVHEFLVAPVEDIGKKPVTDDVSVSKFAWNFALEPETRHEAHWQLQSFVLLEVLAELKEGNKLLKELVSASKKGK
jgi:hypothetical protein